MLMVQRALVVLGCTWIAVPSLGQNPPSPGGSVMGEGAWRKHASNRAMPIFPALSLAAGAQGVAVAYVVSAADGTMGRVDMLEAPDPAIGASVQRALMQWRITPRRADARGPRHFEGRITFYFKIVKGRGSVLNPEQIEGNRDVWRAWYSQDNRPASPGRPAVVRATGAGIREIDPEEATRLVTTRGALIVDVRERDEFGRSHTPGAIVMPVGEILVRSRAEIDRLRPIIVDCSQGERTWCRVGAGLFVKRGFLEVMTIVP